MPPSIEQKLLDAAKERELTPLIDLLEKEIAGKITEKERIKRYGLILRDASRDSLYKAYKDIIPLLLEYLFIKSTNPLAILNYQDENWDTPLHYAVWRKRKYLIEIFLFYGASTSLKNKYKDFSYAPEENQRKRCKGSEEGADHLKKTKKSMKALPKSTIMHLNAIDLYSKKLAENKAKKVKINPFNCSFNLNHQIFRINFGQLQYTLDKWLRSLPSDLKSLQPAIEKIIQGLTCSNQQIVPLQLDLYIIENTLTEIKSPTSPSQVKFFPSDPKEKKKLLQNFGRYAHSVLEKNSNEIKVFYNQIADMNTSSVEIISTFQEQFSKANHQLEHWIVQGSDVAKITDLSKELKLVATNFHEIKLEPNHICNITKNLLSTLVQKENVVDKAWENLQNLQKNFLALSHDPNQFSLLAQCTSQLKLATEDYEEKQKQLNKDLQDFNKCFMFAGTLAKLAGAPKLGEQIVTIGTAAVTIGKSIGSIMAGGAILGPVGIIAGAVGSIVDALSNLFGGGPSQEETMLKELSEQVHKLGQHLDKRLDAIEAQLGVIHKQMHQRFDRIEKVLNVIHKQMHQRFDRIEMLIEYHHDFVSNCFSDIKKSLQILSSEVNTHFKKHEQTVEILSEKQRIAFRVIHEKELSDTISTALSLTQHEDKSTRQKEAVDCAKKLTSWAIIHAKNELSAEKFTLKEKEEPTQKISGLIKSDEGNICYAIQLLAQYFDDPIKPRNFQLANPKTWWNATSGYLSMITLTPGLGFSWDYKADIEKMRKTGEEIRNFIKYLQSNEACFLKVSKNYRECLNEILVKLTTQKTIEEKDIQRLNNACRMLHLYASIAFANDYFNGPFQFHVLQLWNGEEIKELELTHKDSLTFTLKALEKNANDIINELDQLFLVQIKLASNNNNKNCGHPSIDIILEAIEMYEQYDLDHIKLFVHPTAQMLIQQAQKTVNKDTVIIDFSDRYSADYVKREIQLILTKWEEEQPAKHHKVSEKEKVLRLTLNRDEYNKIMGKNAFESLKPQSTASTFSWSLPSFGFGNTN